MCWKRYLLIVLAAVLGGAVLADAAAPPPFRLGVTSDMFSEVHESDVRAAMKVWILTIAGEQGLAIDPDPNIHRSIEELVRFGLEHGVDGFGITTPDYPYLSQHVELGRFAVGMRDDGHTEAYLLLVRDGSGLQDITQLRGGSINLVHNPRMSLATIWLDKLLADAGLGCSPGFFEHLVLDKNPAQVVLPVFFGRTDAALISRSSFELMTELNPQLRQQLRTLAESPPLVPVGFAFRREFVSGDRIRIMQSMAALGDSPAGRQILHLVQSDRIQDQPLSVLDGSLKLLADWDRLCGQTHPRPGVP